MSESTKKKGGKGLIIGLVLLVVFVAIGAVVGLAMAGKINIPGLTPKKKPIPPAAATKEKKPIVPTTSKKDKSSDEGTTKPPVSPESIKQGAAKLAEVWNEMPTDKLVKVVSEWKAPDLAIVFNEMDSTKVAEVIGAMDAKKASLVSQSLQTVAGQIPVQ